MFDIVERGEIEVKGKGKMTTYFLRQNLRASENEIMGQADRISGKVDGNRLDYFFFTITILTILLVRLIVPLIVLLLFCIFSTVLP